MKRTLGRGRPVSSGRIHLELALGGWIRMCSPCQEDVAGHEAKCMLMRTC